MANWMSRIEMDTATVKTYLDMMYPIEDGATQRTKNSVANVRADIITRFENERGTSAWHLANAAVEHIDHGARYRGKTDAAKMNTRFRSVLMGTGADRKAQAFNHARSLATPLV